METLDLAAGLRVVRGGVLEDDPQPLQLGLEQDLAVAGLAAVDGTVVGEQRGRVAMGGARPRWKLFTTSAPLTVVKASQARSSREWSSR